MSTVVARLVAKDLYLQRWLIGVALGGGVLSLLAASINRTSFAIGSVLYLTIIIAYGVVLVMYSVVQERKDKSLLFVLSLPISPAEYVRAKMLSVLSAFVLPWSLLTLATALFIYVTPIPDGMLALLAAVSGLMLTNFCIVLATALLLSSEPIITIAIIGTNMSVSLLFMLLGTIPAIGENSGKDVMVWSAPLLWILATELVVAAIALALPLALGRHKRSLV